MTANTETNTGTNTATDSDTTGLVVRRTIAATTETLFDAWLDPESLAVWIRPGNTLSATVHTDPRVGGAFEIAMHVPGSTVVHSGEYRVIDRPNRLVFTWNSPHTGAGETVVTIDFLPVDAGTELVLTHTGLPTEAVAGHTEGWTDILRVQGETFGKI